MLTHYIKNEKLKMDNNIGNIIKVIGTYKYILNQFTPKACL